jgi:hypothetical protein
MAIRAGMSIAEAILQLTRGFRKMMGRDPDGLEKIKIQQEAVKRLEDVNKVVDMKGNVIDTSKGIMGGKQIQDSPEFGKRIKETYDKAKGPGKGQEMVDALGSPGARRSYEIMEAQLGVRLYGDETFDEILEIQRTGKHPRGEPASGIDSESLKKELMKTDNPFSDLVKTTKKGPKSLQQRRLEAAIDNVSPSLSGDRKVDAELVAEDLAERMGKVYDDLPIKERLKLYDEAYQGLTKKKFDPEGKADGGRIGLKLGMTRRAFMKLMGAAGAGIGALKTGILGLGKQAPEAVETVKETVKQAPDYFFALVDKIKRFGKSVDDAVADPRIEQTYKYKNYELRENAFGEPGETIITKTDDMGEFGYKEESMRFKKGGQTEDGFMPDEYEEVTVRPDAEGKLKDVEDGIEDVSEIIEEATKSAPPIKKAAGGLAYMLGE